MNSRSDCEAPRESHSLLRRLFPPWRERRKKLRRDAWFIIIALYIGLGFAYLFPTHATSTSPLYIWPVWVAFLIRVFIFHEGLVALGIFLVTCLFRRWRMAAVTGPVVLVALGPAIAQYFPRSNPQAPFTAMTVVSINLLMVNETTGPIIEELQTADPDVILFQEYTFDWHEAIAAKLGNDYPYVTYDARDDSFGTAIYSRFPFVSKPENYLPLGSSPLPQIRAVVEIGRSRIAIYNVHLLPPINYEYIVETRLQFANLARLLSEERLPVILGGDFNFTERTPQADRLADIGLRNTHHLAGWGRGTTWPNLSVFRLLPAIRLDHIFLSSELTCSESTVGTGEGSDHRPVLAKIGFVE